MTWEAAPWAIDGARHPASLARLASHAFGGGARGIITPGDLKVRPTAVASDRVLVAPGGAIIPSVYAQAFQESYIVRNPQDDTSPAFTPTSTAARSDLVVVRVEDRNFEGQALTPEEALTFQYVRTQIIPGVPASTRSVEGLGLGYPALELARVDIPAGTSTITSSMIVDLRSLARPKSHVAAWSLTPSGTITANTTVNSWRTLFTIATGRAVPDWATRAMVRASIAGAVVRGGDWEGSLRLALVSGGTTLATTPAPVTEDATGTPGRRFSVPFGDMIEGVRTIAGGNVDLVVQSNRAATTDTGRLEINAQTLFSVDITWLQAAV